MFLLDDSFVLILFFIFLINEMEVCSVLLLIGLSVLVIEEKVFFNVFKVIDGDILNVFCW